jgi:hypothetical protein
VPHEKLGTETGNLEGQTWVSIRKNIPNDPQFKNEMDCFYETFFPIAEVTQVKARWPPAGRILERILLHP